MGPSPQIVIDATTVIIRRTNLAGILDLRHAVLRAGLPRDTAIFPGDDASTTLHLGAFAADRNVGCATFHLNEYHGEPAWQLRGMATADDYRGRGVGAALLTLAQEILMAESPLRLWWCNARKPAVPFYQKQGWRIDSEEFVIPTAGPHFRMIRRLPSG